jgi:DNA-binding IclR family transcriptional regulator
MTITDKATLIKELAKVRTQKYALDNEECEEDIRCVGAPIFDHRGRPFAAISVSGPAYRLTVSRISDLSLLVIDTANTISSRLGYVP